MCVCVCERSGRVRLIPDLEDFLCNREWGGQLTSATACRRSQMSLIFIVNKAVAVPVLIGVCVFALGTLIGICIW